MPNIPNSSSFQPATMFIPNLPPLMWSMVAPILAASIGWKIGTWQVEKTWMRSVTAAIADAHVNVSYCSAFELFVPPCPRQRPKGSRNSQPALSAAWATATFSPQSNVFLAAVDIIIPPLMFRQNVPSFISLSPKNARLGWSDTATPLVLKYLDVPATLSLAGPLRCTPQNARAMA